MDEAQLRLPHVTSFAGGGPLATIGVGGGDLSTAADAQGCGHPLAKQVAGRTSAWAAADYVSSILPSSVRSATA